MDTPEVWGFGTSRSYRPLPAVLRAAGEWEGGAILREIRPPLSVFLFGTIRDVMLFLLPPKLLRAGGFDEAAVEIRQSDLEVVNAPAPLTDYLGILVRVCEGSIDRAEVGSACVGVAGWANEVSAPHTELAYTQAGAIAQPHALTYSLETAKLARELAQYRRAETWFRRTIKRARLAKDRAVYVLAYLGLGKNFGRTGNGPAEKAVTELALRSAIRWRLRELAGCAHHDLIRIWAELGDLRRAYDHAAQAKRYYGDSQSLNQRLAADVAMLWLRAGASERALAVFEAILPHAPDPGIRAVWAAQVARCAANAGLIERFEEARNRAVSAISETRDLWRYVDAEWILALADLRLGIWDRAATAAERALRIATLIGATEAQIGAERTLEDAREHRREGAAFDLNEPPALSRIADRLAGTLQQAACV